MLVIIINKKQLKDDSISEAIICEKGLETYDDLINDNPSTTNDESAFKANSRWFKKFKKKIECIV